MLERIKQLGLVLVLIVAASATLLLSDQSQQRDRQRERQAAGRKDYPSIAVFQIASTALIDAHVSGVVAQLSDKGYLAPDRSNLKIYNPQGDAGVANAIAREIANSAYDIVVTSSTVALQTFANANLATRKPHVFGAVTNPYSTGVGISGTRPDQHPPYLIGIGTFQPVRQAIEIARQMNPSLQRIGVVWNPAEQSSESCLIEARQTVSEHQVALVESVATNTSEVYEATQALIAKEVDAIWIGGDVVATASVGLIVSLATQAGIPVFTNDPTDVAKGALFGLGADYVTVGRLTADQAIAILEGASPAQFGIENVVPEKLLVNETVLGTLADRWQLPPALARRLQNQEQSQEKSAQAPVESSRAEMSLVKSLVRILMDSPGPMPIRVNEKNQLVVNLAALRKAGITPPVELLEQVDLISGFRQADDPPAHIVMVNLVDNPLMSHAIEGIKHGLQEAGLQENRDVKFTLFSAQGDISLLPQLIDRAMLEKPALLMTLTTPAMIAAVHQVKDVPLVFSVASDPVAIGLFSAADRPANVTGTHDDPPLDELLKMARMHDKTLRSVGMIYDASQANARLSAEKLRLAGREQQVPVVEVTVSSLSELSIATQTLIQKGVSAILLGADNTINTGFPAIYQEASRAGVPVYGVAVELSEQGASGVVGNDYFEWGRLSGIQAARVIIGVPVARLPIQPLPATVRIDPKAGSAATTTGQGAR